MPNQVWCLRNHVAELTDDGLQATYDASAPVRGLEGFRVEGQDLSNCQLLGVKVPGRPEMDPPLEVYVRADDLVAKYAPRKSDSVSHQFHYRPIHETGHAIGVELVLSVQTSLPRSDPRIEVINKLGPGELLVRTLVDDGCELLTESSDFDTEDRRPLYFLMRPQELPTMSLVLLVHPSDFFVARASLAERDTDVAFEVFPEALEKGVIRRGIFRNIFVPRHADDAFAQRLLQRLNAQPPSLAT